MRMRRIGFALLASGLFATNGRSTEAASNDPAAIAEPQTVARFHWIGIDHLAANANAAGFMKLWNLPETKRLATQTLDKLALSLTGGEPPVGTNYRISITDYAPLVSKHPAASLLRPLLNDLVQEECYLEVRTATNQPGELALALKMNEARSRLWETNLAKAIELLSGTHPAAAQGGAPGWKAELPAASSPITRQIELTRTGDWTLLGLSAKGNPLLKDLASRIQRNKAPFTPGGNSWAELSADLRGLATAFACGWKLPPETPKVTFTWTGDCSNVLTHGQFHFPRALPFKVQPWNIPTNLIHEPLHSFTAAQGFKSWIAALPAWKKLQAGEPPDQLFTWAQAPSPFLDFAAAPLPNASTVVEKLAARIMPAADQILSNNRMGRVERLTNAVGFAWVAIPAMSPRVEAVHQTGGEFLFAGMAPNTITNKPAPEGTMEALLKEKNAVYFEREITGPRIEAGLYISQLMRLATRRPQLPPPRS